MKKCVHIVTTLELGGAQQNTLFTVENLKSYSGILIYGEKGPLPEPNVPTFRVKFLVRRISPLYDVLAFFKILKILRKIKPFIVHTHSSKAGIIGRWAAYFARVPVIIHTFHGFGFNDWQKPLVKNFFVFLEKITAKITTHLFGVSRENVKKAVNLDICKNEKISVIHSGIDVKKFENTISKEQAKLNFGIPSEISVVGMVACFKEQKAPLDFIEIGRRLKEKIKGIKFILVGDGALRNAIEEKIYEYKLSNDFILTGWRRDIEKVLPAFGVNVLTSLWEGLPRVILEAGVLLIPQVVSDVDGNREIIEDGVNGFLVKPHDIDAFVEKIIYCLENPDVMRIFTRKLRKKIYGDFEINNMVYLIERKYKELEKILEEK